MISSRCAACKSQRRRCPSDCIFSPYFPSNNPDRFNCVHRIYGASNVGRMLQKIPSHLRPQAADSLYYEAQCRLQDPVYGCVGIITQLHQQIVDVESQLAKTRAQIALHNSRSDENAVLVSSNQHEPISSFSGIQQYIFHEGSSSQPPWRL